MPVLYRLDRLATRVTVKLQLNLFIQLSHTVGLCKAIM